MRRCNRCKVPKDLADFHRDAGFPEGRRYTCKACVSDYQILRKYGLTREEWNALYTEQDGKCAVCKTSQPGGISNGLHVDHCHETDQVRGLVCTRCNTCLGLAKDNIDTLLAAVAYLTKQRPMRKRQ